MTRKWFWVWTPEPIDTGGCDCGAEYGCSHPRYIEYAELVSAHDAESAIRAADYGDDYEHLSARPATLEDRVTFSHREQWCGERIGSTRGPGDYRQVLDTNVLSADPPAPVDDWYWGPRRMDEDGNGYFRPAGAPAVDFTKAYNEAEMGWSC